MAWRLPQRRQTMMFPPSLEEVIASDDPVRVYDAFVEALDLQALSLQGDPHQAGCPAYDPKTLLKILVFGYAYGIRSSRKLERALHHNLAFVWLAGGLQPDFKTIARFRKDNRAALKEVLKQCVRLCLELKVVAGNTLFVDGTKLRANASLEHSYTATQCEERLRQIEQRVEEILEDCERTDAQEQEQDSLAHLQEELADHHSRKGRIAEALAKLQAEDRGRINLTDPDCASMRGRQGTHAGYNAQIVVDNQEGLIVHSDVVSDNHDRQQFTPQIAGASETIGHKPAVAGADGGYYSGPELEKMAAVAAEVLVPARGQASDSETRPFAKGRFRYLAQEDAYLCPAGHRLTCRHTYEKRAYREYQLEAGICRACRHYSQCTAGRNGRRLERYFNEDLRDQLRRRYEEPANRRLYARRRQTVELPFGHIKRNLGVDSFLLRGLAGVRAEMALLASGFNITRLIGLFGVCGLLGRLAAL